MDEFSDLDLIIAVEPEHLNQVMPSGKILRVAGNLIGSVHR